MRRGSDAISLALFGTDENEGARSDAGVRTAIEDNGEDKGGMFVNDRQDCAFGTRRKVGDRRRLCSGHDDEPTNTS